jgi:hypothetical protein
MLGKEDMKTPGLYHDLSLHVSCEELEGNRRACDISILSYFESLLHPSVTSMACPKQQYVLHRYGCPRRTPSAVYSWGRDAISP